MNKHDISIVTIFEVAIAIHKNKKTKQKKPQCKQYTDYACTLRVFYLLFVRNLIQVFLVYCDVKSH